MSEDGADVNSQGQTEESSDIPKYHLYIRASLIDHETQGACPMSQQGFMLSYILAQEKNVDFKVWTVSQVNPPPDFRDKNRAKIFPFIEGISGKDKSGLSIAGYMPEQPDDVDKFFDSVNFDCPNLKRPTMKDHILFKIDNISTKFNALMKGTGTEAQITNILSKIDKHLATEETTFIEGDKLSYTDCFLLPRLQHLRVAGKYFRGYEIPHSLKNLWRYLRDAYNTPAFADTLAVDEDLCKFHFTRLGDREQGDLRRAGIKVTFGTTSLHDNVDDEPKKTKTIPDEVAAMLDDVGAENGENGEHNEQEENDQ